MIVQTEPSSFKYVVVDITAGKWWKHYAEGISEESFCDDFFQYLDSEYGLQPTEHQLRNNSKETLQAILKRCFDSDNPDRGQLYLDDRSYLITGGTTVGDQSPNDLFDDLLCFEAFQVFVENIEM